MDEAERCGRVGYIYMSKLVALGTIDELQRLPAANPAGTSRVQIDTPNESKRAGTGAGDGGGARGDDLWAVDSCAGGDRARSRR
jgi:hypothetical protein